MSRASIHKYYFDVISKRNKGPLSYLLRAFLFLTSRIFGAAIYIRSKIVRPEYRPQAFTISIGNIVAGGTGKTPFTIFLAEQFIKAELPTAILLRGYKALAEKQKNPMAFYGEAQADVVGDEACLIGRNVSKALVIAGRNKVQSAKIADAREAKVIIIDDGMQHLKIDRDVEIVMVDSQNPFGYGHLLPRGLLREPLSAFERADLIVLTCRNTGGPQKEVLEIIRQHTSAPMVTGRFLAKGLYDLCDSLIVPDPGKKVAVFTGIAKPEQFVQSVLNLGFDIVAEEFAADHAALPEKQLQNLAHKAKMQGAEFLVCTEKDRVKFAHGLAYNLQLALPVYWLKIGFEIAASDEWDQFCQYIHKKAGIPYVNNANNGCRRSCTTDKKR